MAIATHHKAILEQTARPDRGIMPRNMVDLYSCVESIFNGIVPSIPGIQASRIEAKTNAIVARATHVESGVFVQLAANVDADGKVPKAQDAELMVGMLLAAEYQSANGSSVKIWPRG